MAGQTASLKPSTFSEGGGLISDVDVTIKESQFLMWDYDGKVPTANPVLCWTMVEEDGTEHTQYWSLGQARDWVASEDGRTLVAAGGKTTIGGGTNGGILLASVVNAGFPEDKLGGDVGIFNGMKCHVIRQAAPKRNLQREARADGRQYEDTILVVSKIHQLPWEKKAKRGTSGAAAPAAATQDGDLSEQAMELVMDIVLAEGKAIPKMQLVTKVFHRVKGDPHQNKLVNLVNKDEFLKAGPWKYEGGMVSAG